MSLPLAARGSASATLAAASEDPANSGSNGAFIKLSTSSRCFASWAATAGSRKSLRWQAAKDPETDENYGIDRYGDRPLPRPAFGAAVEKWQSHEQQRHKSWNHQNAEDGESSLPILQPLKYRNVIPLRTRHILGISGVGFGAKFGGSEVSQQAQAADDEQGEDDIEQNLPRIKGLG